MPPDELTSRTSTRSTVDYRDYVNGYAGRQQARLLLAVFGVVVAVGAAVYLNGAWLIMVAALGIGLALSGIGGFLIAADAHATYTRYLAISTSETYSRPAPVPAPTTETVRPFVASQNATNGRTTIAGTLAFAPGVWRDLFNRALANGGVVTRDGAQAARVGAQWYRGDNYNQLLAELTRLGFIDAHKRLTPAAREWYDAAIPLPLDHLPHRSHTERTNGRTNGALSPDLVPVGEAGQ